MKLEEIEKIWKERTPNVYETEEQIEWLISEVKRLREGIEKYKNTFYHGRCIDDEFDLHKLLEEK